MLNIRTARIHRPGTAGSMYPSTYESDVMTDILVFKTTFVLFLYSF